MSGIEVSGCEYEILSLMALGGVNAIKLSTKKKE